ncbi:attractin-like protein 1 [Panonychus citri]|uniref:attractin-like protein 1 n=1 Tax=Panonychus citri TaxID=50023 RepID=UPI0023081530|nr:attractin-like protein 1 [Panonychus citri]
MASYSSSAKVSLNLRCQQVEEIDTDDEKHEEFTCLSPLGSSCFNNSTFSSNINSNHSGDDANRKSNLLPSSGVVRWSNGRYINLVIQMIICLTLIILVSSHSLSPGPRKSSCDHVLCYHGTCQDGRCQCDRGWQGSACHMCTGRTILKETSGEITDGKDNYAIDLQCTWLIDPGKPNSTIRLKFDEFATECSWDHLYIFDGDSIFSPLIGAFSGLLIKEGFYVQEIPEIIATSGRAYLYFYSDTAYNMSGFKISYSDNSCPNNCSNNGACIDGICTCNGGLDGAACDKPICPNKCSGHGRCELSERRCICELDFIGDDCSQSSSQAYWSTIHSIGSVKGRALHQAVVLNDSMWIIGGEFFDKSAELSEFFVRYDLNLKKWDPIDFIEKGPTPRFGHSLVSYNGAIYMFGGIVKNTKVVNELWRYDGKHWTALRSDDNRGCLSGLNGLCAPLTVMGHTANVIGDRMIIIFGHNPIYGYLNTVQEYDFKRNNWTVVNTNGAHVKGGYGHTSVYYPENNLIYVHGGYHSSLTDSILVDLLYSYHPDKKSWRLLNPSQSPRYLHSSVIINGYMYIFGGNGHNATHDNTGDKCFSVQFLAYDIECDDWLQLNQPSVQGSGRFGHSAINYKDQMYIFAGFNSLMLNNLLRYSPSECPPNQPHRSGCSKQKYISSFPYPSKNVTRCAPRSTTHFNDLCQKQTHCHTCLENSYDCIWCGDSCRHEKCKKVSLNSKSITDVSKCDPLKRKELECDKFDNCNYCHTKEHCVWVRDVKCRYNRDHEILTNAVSSKSKTPIEKYIESFSSTTSPTSTSVTTIIPVVNITTNGTNNNNTNTSIGIWSTERDWISAIISDAYQPICEYPCFTRTSCSNCTRGPCMWCSSSQRCIESNAYAAVFPMGQCMEWTIHPWRCSGLNCEDIQTCDACQNNPRCGWCEDGSNTGVGKCMEGSYMSPRIPESCPAKRWHFVSCPDCQCNGHSHCTPETSVCENCKDLTEGLNCQKCMEGHYGNPVNGGTCRPCFCYNHSSKCNSESGKCYCTTKGIIGHHCDKCDESSHYYGNPTEPGGSCYYNLSVDFQYTFNMSKPEDSHFTRINFMNVPAKPDVDVDFTIACSSFALVNISVGSPTVTWKHSRLECGSFKIRFSREDTAFGNDNSTFYVNVFDFQTPILLQISFSQHRTLDLLQFFVTFSSCFLTLLIIAAVMWKIKQRYDMYRRRQQLYLELEHRASRPFASILIELNNEDSEEMLIQRNRDNEMDSSAITNSTTTTTTNSTSAILPSRCDPTPIALEPCATNKAAVLSLILRLPSGGSSTVPPGQTGLAIGSALVSLGTLDQKCTKCVT